MKINIPGTKKWCFLKLKCEIVDAENAVVGLHSGPAFRDSHHIFLDYDDKEFSLVESDMQRIVKENSLRRGVVVESSPGKWWGLSFSPTPYEKMVGICKGSAEDRNHALATEKKGYSTIRHSMKRKSGWLPRIVKVIENSEGTNFYGYIQEQMFMKRFELLMAGV